MKDLGLLGVQVLSNVDGKPLDSPEEDAEKVFHFNVERLLKL
ncbi:hypothetical protein HS1genome_0790 [Sulfodiicoccus acidiphilus]|uniref:Uncharacterized protein n=1 Tax=Sulfodiicoccus acidiphilus TaxID=1670455 RepID=A0A348B2J9_9CREN|nr:hypothetical protein [Sulfodiicoccus acidiphilus]BBD72401.1 hypothetical protein HS1genome_0790 [Sulfodiicoccus acidiphilus]GGT97397.1 hypothetical protein GCM10007116_13650 [Sulfodiicoccus acidiphilus]